MAEIADYLGMPAIADDTGLEVDEDHVGLERRLLAAVQHREVARVVPAVLVDDGQPVEYAEPLAVIERG